MARPRLVERSITSGGGTYINNPWGTSALYDKELNNTGLFAAPSNNFRYFGLVGDLGLGAVCSRVLLASLEGQMASN